MTESQHKRRHIRSSIKIQTIKHITKDTTNPITETNQDITTIIGVTEVTTTTKEDITETEVTITTEINITTEDTNVTTITNTTETKEMNKKTIDVPVAKTHTKYQHSAQMTVHASSTQANWL